MLRSLLFLIPIGLQAQNHFDAQSGGTLAPSSGWTAGAGVTATISCSQLTPTLLITPTAAIVSGTNVSDANCANIAGSPLGGSGIVQLNKANTLTYPYLPAQTQIWHTFTVSPANYLFTYAVKAVLEPSGHSCCDMPGTFFNFYDGNNSLLSGISKTLAPSSMTACTTDTAGWTAVGFQRYGTNNWVVNTVDLSIYTGTAVKVEVIAKNCPYQGHLGYAYYDAINYGHMISVNGIFAGSSSFTSCSSTATLSASGLEGYYWQGPGGSGISGSTLSAISTSAAGVYTLTGHAGNLSHIQTFSLSFSPAPPPAIVSTATAICRGDTLLLDASSPAILSYSWDFGANTSTVLVSPDSTAAYQLVTTFTNGCQSMASTTVSVIPVPELTVTATHSTVCAGNTVTLSALSGSAVTYSWANGGQQQVTMIHPVSSGLHSATVTNTGGCSAVGSVSVTVNSRPVIQFVAIPQTICAGDTVMVSASSPSAVAYLWAHGNNSAQFMMVADSTSQFSLTVTNHFGCVSTSVAVIQVFPIPVLQVTSNPSVLCTGESATISVSGSSNLTYTWSSGVTQNSITVTPTATSVYSVMATGPQGCTSGDTVQLVVSGCLGMADHPENNPLAVFPNPSNGIFTVSSGSEAVGIITDCTGRVIVSFRLERADNYSAVFTLPAGAIYFVSGNFRSRVISTLSP